MKQLLPAVFLLVLLTNCHKQDEPAPAPDLFLGRWQAETLEILFYDATGKLTSDHVFQRVSQLDVTASTLTTTQTVNGQLVVEAQPYTRTGEVLTLAKPPAGYTCYCRKLSNATFTFEYNETPVAGQPFTIQLVAYHR
ncbi:MAG: hypothetical protein EOO60_11015 [Hymenobacter sp.]|nr:MAG: hypothetical protein EOO60_11015 [Hymenobacter sp.]